MLQGHIKQHILIVKKIKQQEQIGSKLLAITNIQEYILEKQKEIQERTEITQDKVIKELANIAFLDIRKLYNESGGLKNIQDIDEETVKAVSSLETLEEYDSRGENREKIGNIRKVKLLDKTKALELLGKHLGMFSDVNVNLKNAIQVELIDDVNE